MSLGIPEIILILVVILVLFGGKRIPELARGLGKAQAEYKKAKEAIEKEAQEFKDEVKKADKKKLKKGEKLVNFSSEDTFSLCEKYKNGAESDRQRMMFTLQSLFNALVVIPSFDKRLIDSNNLTLSGDGSSLHIHASVFGHKVEVPDIEGDKIYRFSAPEADIGWDSDLESFYLGFTFSMNSIKSI